MCVAVFICNPPAYRDRGKLQRARHTPQSRLLAFFGARGEASFVFTPDSVLVRGSNAFAYIKRMVASLVVEAVGGAKTICFNLPVLRRDSSSSINMHMHYTSKECMDYDY